MRLPGVLRLLPVAACLAGLAGCSSALRPSSEAADARLSGAVHGGQQPVSGASIQLYAAGTTGDGSAATPLLTTPVHTDSNGNFNITSDYTCPASNPQVYLVATGGNPGLPTPTNNTALAMMTALGPCDTLSASTFITVNELTTVGAIAALYPYASGYAGIGSAPGDAASLAAAFATASVYVDPAAGTVPGPSLPAGYYASSREILSLGDDLAACINTSGQLTVFDNCGELFTFTQTAAGVRPTDTIGALINILKAPTQNVVGIFYIAPPNGPFQPSLTRAPSDWTLPILPVPPAPTFSLAAGTYFGTPTVTLSDAAPGTTIFYTTDGSTPSLYPPSYAYSGPISVLSSETVKAIAVSDGRAFSAVSSAAYTISPPPTALYATAGTLQSARSGSTFATPLQVHASDSVGRAVSNALVSFSSPATGAGATLQPATCTTDSTGSCSVVATANTFAGSYSVTASTGGLSATFSLTNTVTPAFVVTVLTDTTTGVAANCGLGANSHCSLRDALAAAAQNASSAAPVVITFAQTAAGTITLQNGALPLPSYTTVQGATSGSGLTLTNLTTISGNNQTPVFTEASGIVGAALNNLSVMGGLASSSNSGVGGGLAMSGSLTVTNSTFYANQASASGAGIGNNGGTLSVFGCTFYANQALGGYGGGLDTYGGGTSTVSNSTFAGNSAGYGGAISGSGTTIVTSSTIAGNSATYGGGVDNRGSMTVTNSIVTGDIASAECHGIGCYSNTSYVVFAAGQGTGSGTITLSFHDSVGNSFVQSSTYGQFGTPAALASAFGAYLAENYLGKDTALLGAQGFGNILVLQPLNVATLGPITITNTGTAFSAVQTVIPSPLASATNVVGVTAAQANLSPLGFYGGPTQTIVPLAGSVALCAITPATGTGTDQRGQPRTVVVGSSTCQDAGAVQTAQ